MLRDLFDLLMIGIIDGIMKCSGRGLKIDTEILLYVTVFNFVSVHSSTAYYLVQSIVVHLTWCNQLCITMASVGINVCL